MAYSPAVTSWLAFSVIWETRAPDGSNASFSSWLKYTSNTPGDDRYQPMPSGTPDIWYERPPEPNVSPVVRIGRTLTPVASGTRNGRRLVTNPTPPGAAAPTWTSIETAATATTVADARTPRRRISSPSSRATPSRRPRATLPTAL